MQENQSCLTMYRPGALSNVGLQDMWDDLFYYIYFKTLRKRRLDLLQPSIFSYFYSIVERADS